MIRRAGRNGAAAAIALWLVAPGLAQAAEVVDVAMGSNSGCAVQSDGALSCFGWSPAFARDADQKLRVVPGVRAKAVSVGSSHLCIVDPKGDVQCVGSGAAMEVLPGRVAPEADDIPDPDAARWQKVPTVANATQLGSGRHHTCALTKAGEVYCWGSPYYGRVGSANKDGKPAKVPGLGTVTELLTAGDSNCVVSTDKKVRCFGEDWSDEKKQLKQGDVVTLAAPSLVSVGMGFGFACGLTEDRLRVVCAGRTEEWSGKEGDGPHTLTLPEKATRMISGAAGPCALGESGKVWCAGQAQALLVRSGDVKAGAWAAYETPVKQAAFSFHDVLAVGRDGGLLWAGSVERGPLPQKLVSTRAVPVVGLDNVAEIRAGSAHVCARLEDGTVKCWGSTNKDGAVPRVIAGLGDVAALDAAGIETCVRHGSGALSCFETRDAENQRYDVLKAPASVKTAKGLAVGTSHACFIDARGKVACWGSAYDQALGFAPKEQYPKPTPEPVNIAGLDDVTQLDAGSNATCALGKAGGVRCWGRNEAGILGHGTNDKAASVADVIALGPATKISVGERVACALGKDQRAHCWGGDALAPIPWPGAADVIDVAVGGQEQRMSSSGACILHATGSVECGLPGASRLIKGVEGATAVTAGHGFGCALLKDKTVRCWGKRDAGQLGDGRPPITTKLEAALLP